MLTVDFDRLGVRPGCRAIDIGAGAGRHSFELYRRGADVVAFDRSADDMKAVADMFVAMELEGQVPKEPLPAPRWATHSRFRMPMRPSTSS